MTKYEDIIKQKVNKEPIDIDAIARKYNMSVVDVKHVKAEIDDLKETLKSRDYTRQHDYQFLIDENRRLEEERNMLLLDNKRLAHQIDDQVNRLRKAGVL